MNLKNKTFLKHNSPYLEIQTITVDIRKRVDQEGTVYLKSAIDLGEYPKRVTSRLQYWATRSPEKTFLAQRGSDGTWKTLSYSETYSKIQKIGQYLLSCGASVERPIAILSGNSLEHGLLALAAMHIGIPYAAVSQAYSLKSTGFRRLKHCLDLLTPGLLFVQDAKQFKKPIDAFSTGIPTIAVSNLSSDVIGFDSILKGEISKEVSKAFDNISTDTIAKILFTSGSTGMPKGVINTHGNLMANLQQITQTYPFMAEEGLTLIDWLPWNHTFGGNHNFGLALYNGGSLYIDEGSPTPKGISTTLRNLGSIAPTVYFNVPKGFEVLVQHLKENDTVCATFFSRLKMLFYAGASMSQHLFEDLEMLALKTTGTRIFIGSGHGMTEACPSTMLNSKYGDNSKGLGVPVPGLEAKLVPLDDTFEARFRGPNLTPGYWRDQAQTKIAFDDEGFYRSGDALKFVSLDDPNHGMIFDGRLTENFKLSSGTWVNVGELKSKLIASANGLIKDVILIGSDESYIGAILFPEFSNCARLAGFLPGTITEKILKSDVVKQSFQNILNELGKESSGTSTTIRRAIVADFIPSSAKGELTDKGSINQRAVLSNRRNILKKMYSSDIQPGVFEIKI